MTERETSSKPTYEELLQSVHNLLSYIQTWKPEFFSLEELEAMTNERLKSGELVGLFADKMLAQRRSAQSMARVPLSPLVHGLASPVLFDSDSGNGSPKKRPRIKRSLSPRFAALNVDIPAPTTQRLESATSPIVADKMHSHSRSLSTDSSLVGMTLSEVPEGTEDKSPRKDEDEEIKEEEEKEIQKKEEEMADEKEKEESDPFESGSESDSDELLAQDSREYTPEYLINSDQFVDLREKQELDAAMAGGKHRRNDLDRRKGVIDLSKPYSSSADRMLSDDFNLEAIKPKITESALARRLKAKAKTDPLILSMGASFHAIGESSGGLASIVEDNDDDDEEAEGVFLREHVRYNTPSDQDSDDSVVIKDEEVTVERFTAAQFADEMDSD